MALSTISKALVALLSVLQLGTALAIVAIIALHLAGVEWQRPQTLLSSTTCLLSQDGGTALCYYAYALGAVSVLFTLAIGLLQVCTCNACGCGAGMDTVMAVLAAGWWVVGAFLLSTNSTRANAAGLPKREWRETVAWLTWITAGLFGAMFAVHASRLLSKCCRRCCGRRRRGGEADPEKAVAARPRAAALELGKEVKGRAYMAGRGGEAGGLQSQFVTGRQNI
ncbi:hypothetical protein Rsub_09597 [Raphidocelis subcapitata]|uniref:MARVEL domain-containing protein n=1 Tax=Raphidocelis subcapitata TaxID=307507 RepID=A0A2V0PC42_9CHLO|nr:hypothetical protein Rsub_09597 [Raphidocelis subcapitata]|eukprot:GBF97431.1 hypothetical protein Rsub_09597 [Raphidocelis subcapitata]